MVAKAVYLAFYEHSFFIDHYDFSTTLFKITELMVKMTVINLLCDLNLMCMPFFPGSNKKWEKQGDVNDGIVYLEQCL